MNDEGEYNKKLIALEFITNSIYRLESIEQIGWFDISIGTEGFVEQFNVYKVIVIHYEILDGFLTFTTENYDTIGVNVFDIKDFKASYDAEAIKAIREEIEEVKERNYFCTNCDEVKNPKRPKFLALRKLFSMGKIKF